MPRRSQPNICRAIRDPGSTIRYIYRHPDSLERDDFDATHTAPVPPDSPIIAWWSTLAPYIIQKLDSCQIDWAAVECFQRLRKDIRGPGLKGETTVVITVRETLSKPNQIAEMVGEICRMSGCRVELQFCDLNLINPPQQTDTTLSIPEVGYPPVGSKVSLSTGLENPTEATVGGILRLVGKENKEEEYFALTCFHSLPKFEVHETNGMNLEPGNPRKQVRAYDSVRCAFPSQLLQAEFLSDISFDIHRTNTKIQHLEGESKQAEKRVELGMWKSRLLRLKAKETSIHSMDSHIGFVAATSGLSVHNDRHLDWALIALSGLEKPSWSVNRIPNIQERSKTPVRLSNWSEKLEAGARVCKMGSTSVTEGVVNLVPSYVRFRETEHNIPIAIEWAVIPTAKYKSFSEPGDSGAWVVDCLGNHLVGMILGRNSGLGVSYVTPIREIIEDIEYFTNKTVFLPH